MKNWSEYKDYVRTQNVEDNILVDEVEETTKIISAMITQRKNMGLTQRELAAICELPQSTIARLESCATTPRLDTLMLILNRLGLKLSILSVETTSL